MKIYVATVEALRKKESQDETEFTSKTAGKTSLWSQIFCYIKFSFPVTRLVPYDGETNRSRPLIVGLYENSIVQSFRGKKEQAKSVLSVSVKKSMTTEEATCRIVGWKVTNSKMCLALL